MKERRRQLRVEIQEEICISFSLFNCQLSIRFRTPICIWLRSCLALQWCYSENNMYTRAKPKNIHFLRVQNLKGGTYIELHFSDIIFQKLLDKWKTSKPRLFCSSGKVWKYFHLVFWYCMNSSTKADFKVLPVSRHHQSNSLLATNRCTPRFSSIEGMWIKTQPYNTSDDLL